MPFRATADCAERFVLGSADGLDFDSARRQKLLLSILESPQVVIPSLRVLMPLS